MSKKLKKIGITGSGYFCDVYKFKDENTHEIFAAKKLKKKHYSNDTYRYRLLREIKLLNDLKECEEIIDLIKDGNNREKESLWYMMPCADTNLYKYIRKNNQKISLETRFEFAEQIIRAIKYAHNKNILHRDISPNNVLVFRSDLEVKIKVSDFGLGKDQESLSHYTGSSVDSYGQILYVSPEQRIRLKDATIQSDIYSLGKLLYFIFTARDPDNMKSCTISLLITKATEEEPSKRYENMEELENHFLALKKLQFDQTVPVEYLSIKDFLASKDKSEVDWDLFHQIVLKGTVRDHVFSDFLEPVIQIFHNASSITKYQLKIGSDFKYFVQRFSEHVYECLGMIAWPFNATDSFGAFLKEVVLRVNDSEVRLISLKLMWHLAYVVDQWSVQSDIKPLLKKLYVSDDIEISLADFIQSNPIELNILEFDNYELPPIIKKSIILANENHKKQNAEKNSNPDDWDF